MAGYTGVVSVGGPAQVRELAHLRIAKLAVSAMANNVYLLTCRATGEQLLVDAADDPDAIATLVESGGAGLQSLVTTHRHWDHVRALEATVQQFAPRTYAGRDDASHLPMPADVALLHGDRIELGQVSLEVVALRGHTPGSIALAYDDLDGVTHLFTGDSLFPGGVGKTWSAEDFDSLYADVVARVFDVYPDSTWVYPGHGADTTLGAQRPHLSEWRARGW